MAQVSELVLGGMVGDMTGNMAMEIMDTIIISMAGKPNQFML